MTTETQTQAQNSLKDRSVTIQVSPVLDYHSLDPLNIGTSSVGYEVIASDPPGTATVNAATGTIDISQMPPDSGYTENIDITFKLNTSTMLGPDGGALTGSNTPRWANKDEGGTYTNSKGKTEHFGFGWFCQITDLGPPPVYDRNTPIEIDKMKFKRKDDLTLEIDDDTPDGSPPYAYLTAFVLPGAGNYYISLDPVLSRKGIGSHNFMLKD